MLMNSNEVNWRWGEEKVGKLLLNLGNKRKERAKFSLSSCNTATVHANLLVCISYQKTTKVHGFDIIYTERQFLSSHFFVWITTHDSQNSIQQREVNRLLVNSSAHELNDYITLGLIIWVIFGLSARMVADAVKEQKLPSGIPNSRCYIDIGLLKVQAELWYIIYCLRRSIFDRLSIITRKLYQWPWASLSALNLVKASHFLYAQVNLSSTSTAQRSAIPVDQCNNTYTD